LSSSVPTIDIYVDVIVMMEKVFAQIKLVSCRDLGFKKKKKEKQQQKPKT
jgi:hypothetical protein